MSLSMEGDPADSKHVCLRGELDTFNARDLVEALKPLVRQGRGLSLDLSQVTFVEGFGDGYLATAELYHPGSESWTRAGRMGTARGYHTATVWRTAGSWWRVDIAGGTP